MAKFWPRESRNLIGPLTKELSTEAGAIIGDGDRNLPLHQEPGKKSGKPGQVWFNQTYQAFVKKTSSVKSLVRLVLPGF